MPTSSTTFTPVPDETAYATQDVEYLITAQGTQRETATALYPPGDFETSEPAFQPQPRALLQHYQEQRDTRSALGALSLRITFFESPYGDEVSPSDLDAIAVSFDVANLMNLLGIQPTIGRSDEWREDREFLKALMERFATRGDDDIRLQCAACLRHAQLSWILRIEVGPRLKFWDIKPLSALESIARMALDLRSDDFSRSLAEAILTQDTHVAQLWNLDKQYAPLAHKLTIALGKHLYYDEKLRRLALAG